MCYYMLFGATSGQSNQRGPHDSTQWRFALPCVPGPSGPILTRCHAAALPLVPHRRHSHQRGQSGRGPERGRQQPLRPRIASQHRRNRPSRRLRRRRRRAYHRHHHRATSQPGGVPAAEPWGGPFEAAAAKAARATSVFARSRRHPMEPTSFRPGRQWCPGLRGSRRGHRYHRRRSAPAAEHQAGP